MLGTRDHFHAYRRFKADADQLGNERRRICDALARKFPEVETVFNDILGWYRRGIVELYTLDLSGSKGCNSAKVQFSAMKVP